MQAKYTLTSDLAAHVANDPALEQQIAANPVQALAALSMPPALQNDHWIYRIVVLALGMAILITLTGAIYLAATSDKETPQILTAIGSAAVGALAGLLAPSPANN